MKFLVYSKSSKLDLKIGIKSFKWMVDINRDLLVRNVVLFLVLLRNFQILVHRTFLGEYSNLVENWYFTTCNLEKLIHV